MHSSSSLYVELRTSVLTLLQVVVVDVDNNKMLFPESLDDSKMVPPWLLDPLIQSLRTIATKMNSEISSSSSGISGSSGRDSSGSKAPSQFSLLGTLMDAAARARPKSHSIDRRPLPKPLIKDIQNVFIAFMVDLLANYKDFLRKSPLSKSSAAADKASDPFSAKYFDTNGYVYSTCTRFHTLVC